MIAGLAPALVLGVLLAGGLVKGVAGFGYAVVSTTALALVLEPAVAVVVVIVPMLATNVQLVTELNRETFSACFDRFWPYLAAAVVGTVVGMALLDRVPSAGLAFALGVLTAAYVLARQPYVSLPGAGWFRRTCVRPGAGGKAALGFASGVVFGVANIGVQVVAYLDALDLDRSTFVGVLAMILVGVSTLRVGAAWYLGLYDAAGALPLSVAGIVPGVAGVAAGRRLREHVPERYQVAGTLALLSVIAVRLSMKGVPGTGRAVAPVSRLWRRRRAVYERSATSTGASVWIHAVCRSGS